MSTALWYLLLLVPVFAIVYVWWAYRNNAAAKEAASRERLTALVGIVEGARAARSGARKEQTAPAVVSKPATAAAAPPAAPPRFLTQPATLMYYVLKAGLPDHEIFPRVSLASVMAGAENTPRSALAEGRPARHEIDFVICDKSMQVVAAVQLDAQPGGQESQVVNQRLSAAGIRLVRFNPAALPRREQVRALIFGQSR
jgi:Protein of unknown function (DUF2726)